MNQVMLNEMGLADLLASDLRKIESLAIAVNYLLTSNDYSVYARDAAELADTIRMLATDAEKLRKRWVARIPRTGCVCPGGVR